MRGKIFATVPDEHHLNVFIDPDEVSGFVAEWPAACAQLWWGKQLRGVHVALDAAEPGVVAELLTDAWRHKAPASLHAQLPTTNP